MECRIKEIDTFMLQELDGKGLKRVERVSEQKSFSRI